MNFEQFEDIIAWQKSKSFTIEIFKLFENFNNYNFKNQIERASLSVMNNIAEGFERKSNKEFKYFLYVSKGSCAEVRSMLYIAFELKYINEEHFNDLISKSLEISKIISGLIKIL